MADDKLLRNSAKLLVARERELHAMKRKHVRLARWLRLAQSLPAVIDPKKTVEDGCAAVSELMISALDLQRVLFFAVGDATIDRVGTQGAPGPGSRSFPIDRATHDLITSTDPKRNPLPDSMRGFDEAVGLERYLWYLLTPAGGQPLLFVAGYDRERAGYYAPFDEDDVAHFVNTARQISLLLGQNNLVRDLEIERNALKALNTDLERRVETRTGELAEALRTLREKDRRLQADIEEARVFQHKVIADVPRSASVDFFSAYRPLERVGGDVYDVCEIRERLFRIFLVDVTGHGVQASMRTILIRNEYDRLRSACAEPSELLGELNRRLVELFPEGEIMSAGCCVDIALDGRGDAVVSYANAGGAPLFLMSGATVSEVYQIAPLLAVQGDQWPEPLRFTMTRGDSLVIPSDGLTEQRNAQGRAFEDELPSLGTTASSSAAETGERILRAFDEFRGAQALADDVTLVLARLRTTGTA